MNKDELLSKIKEENENEEPYETEVSTFGWNIGAVCSLAVALLIGLFERILLGEYNVSVYLVAFSTICFSRIAISCKIRTKLNVFMAVLFSVGLLGVFFLYFLVTL